MSSSASDRTVNKITLCGAIFAGVAYVGYTVVKQAFGKTFLRGDKPKEGKFSLLDKKSCFYHRIGLEAIQSKYGTKGFAE